MRALTWLAAVVFFLSVGATTFLLVDPHTAGRLVENWPGLNPDAKAQKIVSLVKTNWLFYGTVALFAGFAWAGLVRAGRLPRGYRPPVRPAERSVPPAPRPEPSPQPAPARAAPGMEEILGQFEINWKTFASYTQDILHRKIQELEGPQEGLREVSEKVSSLGKAIEEIKSDIAGVRGEIQGVSRGVTEKVGRVLEKAPAKERAAPDADGALKKLETELRAALEKLSGLDERGLKLVKVIEDERNEIISKRLAEESRKLERSWSEKVSTFAAQAAEARKECEGVKAELVRAQEAHQGLRREVEQASAREKKVERDLEAAVRAEARRVDEVKSASSQIERAKKEIEKKEKEFSEERRRLCSKVEELEAQGTILESEKGDAERELERVRAQLEADVSEREKLRIAAESARAVRERAEAEFRRLAEELKALRSGKAQARAHEVVALGEENARLQRELEAARRELEESRERLEKKAPSGQEEAAPVPAVAREGADLARRLEEARAQLADREERHHRLEAEASNLRKEIQSREAEIERLRKCSAAAESLISQEDSEKALQAYRSEIERLELARFDEGRKAQLLEEEAKRFKARLAELEEASRAREEKLRAQLAEKEEKRAREAAALAEDHGAASSAAAEPARVEELERERGDLLTSLDKLGGELERLRGDIDGFRRFQGTLIDGSIPAAISGVDTNLKVFAWNPAAEALWKIEADAVLGRRLPELSLAGLGPEILAEVDRAMAEKQTVVPPRATFMDPEGKVRHLQWSFDPILGPGDESLGSVLIADDVTEEVEREIEARVQALFSKSLLRSLPAALIVLDVQRRVINWNRGAEQLLGLSESEVVGKDFFSLRISLAKPAFQKRFEDSAKDGAVHRLRVRFDLNGVAANHVVTQAPFYGSDESVRGSMLIIEPAAVPVPAK